MGEDCSDSSCGFKPVLKSEHAGTPYAFRVPMIEQGKRGGINQQCRRWAGDRCRNHGGVTLETLAESEKVKAGSGWTDIFIYPLLI